MNIINFNQLSYEQTKNITNNILEKGLLETCQKKAVTAKGGLASYFKISCLFLLPLFFGFLFNMMHKKFTISANILLLVTIAVFVLSLVTTLIVSFKRNYVFFYLIDNFVLLAVCIITSLFLIDIIPVISKTLAKDNTNWIFNILCLVIIILSLILVVISYYDLNYKLFKTEKPLPDWLQSIKGIIAKLTALGIILFGIAIVFEKAFRKRHLVLHHNNLHDQIETFVAIWIFLPLFCGATILLVLVYFPIRCFLPAYYLLKYRKEYEQEYNFSYQGLPESN
ncbi:hypothetical protein [Bombilactobacillus thymidiniphilus]|uniref:Integral membrane protein n=1 Tax=Bombilactobacillus thymidiniphilus TaxID=2923363 RepID=A0ABY4PFD9_9LACO|nr:hypothetical protein [Bombilactobacillus thymidiniphilus]UQS84300.1 hypothetical protein MOO47_03890 [Bombilactobacillus thymidiniphilus]